MNGFQAEVLVKGEIRGMGLTQPRLPSEDKLVALAAKHAPKRLKQVQERLAENGVSLYSFSAYDVLDHVYGLDFIVKSKGSWVGIDVTIDTCPGKLGSKAAKMEKLMPLYAALGIKKVGIYNPNLTTLKAFLETL